MAAKKKKGPAKARVRGSPVEVEVTIVKTDVLDPMASAATALPKAQPPAEQPAEASDSTSSSSSSSSGVSISMTKEPVDMSVPTVVPRLVVLDLDMTMWAPEMYQIKGPPFRVAAGRVLDRAGTHIALFPAARDILEELHTHTGFASTRVATASRTTRPSWAREVMSLIEVFDGLLMEELFDFAEIYPGDKLAHFEELKEQSGVPFEQMLFFDDLDRNTKDVARLGVTTVHTPGGLTQELWRSGLRAYAAKGGR